MCKNIQPVRYLKERKKKIVTSKNYKSRKLIQLQVQEWNMPKHGQDPLNSRGPRPMLKSGGVEQDALIGMIRRLKKRTQGVELPKMAVCLQLSTQPAERRGSCHMLNSATVPVRRNAGPQSDHADGEARRPPQRQL